MMSSKIFNINYAKSPEKLCLIMNILCLTIFFFKIDSFWVISLSKAWRLGRGQAGSFHILTIWVKINAFYFVNHISEMFRFRDTKLKSIFGAFSIGLIKQCFFRSNNMHVSVTLCISLRQASYFLMKISSNRVQTLPNPKSRANYVSLSETCLLNNYFYNWKISFSSIITCRSPLFILSLAYFFMKIFSKILWTSHLQKFK